MLKNVKVLYPGEKEYNISVQIGQNKNTITILEIVFAACNRGSSRESEQFLNLKCRSLSVGDFVQIDGVWYHCRMVGWEKVSPDEFEKILSKINQLIKDNPGRSSFWASHEIGSH